MFHALKKLKKVSCMIQYVRLQSFLIGVPKFTVGSVKADCWLIRPNDPMSCPTTLLDPAVFFTSLGPLARKYGGVARPPLGTLPAIGDSSADKAYWEYVWGFRETFQGTKTAPAVGLQEEAYDLQFSVARLGPVI